MQRRFKQAFTSIKEHSSVSYAKIAAMGGFQDLDLVIIKATSPEDLPLDDKYVHELLKIFTSSPSSFRAYSLSFSRRFGKTECWRVALKCLVLLHRLIRLFPHDSKIKDEIIWARYKGLLSLDPCYFRDSSSSSSEYYTVFIRSYARLLDEALDCLFLGSNKIDKEIVETQQTMSEKMKEVERLLVLLPRLQSLVDRIIDCKPIGPAEKSFLLQSSMKYIIRDSFFAYKSYRKDIEFLLEMLMQMPYKSGSAAFAIYKKASIQADRLIEFYDWNKSWNLCGSYEYPHIEKIPIIQINALEAFLNGLWQSSESSFSSDQSPFPSIHDENREDIGTEAIERVIEIEPLIKFDEIEKDDSWEAILESSISPTNDTSFSEHIYGYGFRNTNNFGREQQKVQIYSPQGLNQSNHPYNINPTCPWGL